MHSNVFRKNYFTKVKWINPFVKKLKHVTNQKNKIHDIFQDREIWGTFS